MPVSVFSLFLSFTEKEYQTESKRNETFTMIFLGPEDIQRTWSASHGSHKAATRTEDAPSGVGRAPHHCGPLVTPPTYFFSLYILKYSKTNQESHQNTYPPPQPSVPMRSHLGAFLASWRRGIRSRRASTSTPLPLR